MVGGNRGGKADGVRALSLWKGIRPRVVRQRTLRSSTSDATTDGSARVEVSPSWSGAFSAILRRMRRMILPERVFGRPGAHCRWSGVAIGPIATPDHLQWAPGLPKTRSGKIMRRILRKIATAEYEGLGDISTLADPGVVQHLIDTHKTMNVA